MKQTIYVFDLDGVITDPANTQVDTAAIRDIYNLLNDDHYVAINTGRSYEWVKDNLIQTLIEYGGDALFDRLYVVCEKGGESLLWDGNIFALHASRYALHDEDVARCKQVFDQNAVNYNTMFWDATKRTMATFEKYPEKSLSVFHDQQAVLAAKLKEVFADREVKIDATIMATDVEHPQAGKHAGAELIYEWAAKQPGTQNAAFVCFGDSKSDYEMARYFASQGHTTTFVFVGKKDIRFDEHDQVTLVQKPDQFVKGTREYLREHVQ